MRVALITAHWPPRLSGVGDYSWHLAHALSTHGATVDVLVTGQDEVAPAEHDWVRVRTAPSPNSPRSLMVLAKEICSLDVTVACLQFEAHAFGLAALPHGLPLVLRMRGIPNMVFYHELWRPKHLGRTAKVFLLNAPHSVGVSTAWHAAGVRRIRIVGKPPLVLPIASNIRGSRFGMLDRVRYGLPAERVVMTFFGIIGPQHCVAELIEALAQIRAAGNDACLSVIGAVDFLRNGYHQRLRRMVAEFGLEDHVTWHGRIIEDDAIARLMAVSDIGVIPYLGGVGENNTAFMACARFGLPIVTTCGVRSSRLEERGVALFTEPTAAGLSDAICRLIDGSDIRHRLGGAARIWADENDWEMVAMAYLREFERISA